MSDTHSSDERNPKKIKMTKGMQLFRGIKRTMATLAQGGPIQVGATVPSVTFKCRVRDAELKAKGEENPFAWKDVTSEDLFKGKRSVIFCLPGAFTPTCSSTHVPGYEKKYEELKAAGIDEVYCFSVNDAFVMRQWGLKLGLTEDMETGNFKNVKLIPDGAALFTRGMGLNCVWEVERGFGERSWRYSALINDMKVEAINIEPGFVNSEETRDFGPDPFEVSDADTMLKTINALKEE